MIKAFAETGWSVRENEVAAALARLPRHQREVITLTVVEDASCEETAEISGCAIGTLKSRFNQLRARILVGLGKLRHSLMA